MPGLRDPLTGGPARRRPGPKPGANAPLLHASVESDGTPEGTHVYLEDGTELTQAQRITWQLDAGTGEAVLTVRLGLSSLHALGRLDLQAGQSPDGKNRSAPRGTP